MSIPVPSAPNAGVAPLAALLPLSARARPGERAAARATVSWGGRLPGLPASLAQEIEREWGLFVTTDAAAPDPLALPAFTALYAQARADQVLRAYSHRTNLVLSGTTTLVVGDGAVAEALTGALTRIGSRVVRVAAGPLPRLRALLAGLETAENVGSHAASAHAVIATGENHAPLDPAGVAAVFADASPDASGLVPTGGATARLHVERVDHAARVVSIAPPLPADIDEEPGLAWRNADLLVALSLFEAAESDPDAADLRLARTVLA